MKSIASALVCAAVATGVALASRPEGQCAAVADAWCNAQRPGAPSPINCDSSVAEGPLVTLFDSDAQGGPPQWRCYSRETLNPSRTKYVSGTGYCTRNSSLTDELRNCAAGITTNPTPVFMHGETASNTNTTYPCIRIPSIVRLPESDELLAFAECRRWVGDGCAPVGGAPDDADSALGRTDWRDVCTKTSTDGGRTWGALVVIANCTMQPTPVVIPPEAGTSQPPTIVLHGNRCPASTVRPSGNVQIVSRDGGKTWSQPEDLLRFLGPDVDGADVGPGVGLRLDSDHPVAPGRLLFIGHRGAYVHDFVWYSDDDAATWKVSDTSTFAGMDEAQLVQVPAHAAAALGAPAGAVMANMRSDHLNKSCDCRAFAISTDGGASFSDVQWDSALISPVCQATIISGASPSGNGSALYFANPASKSQRAQGTVRASFNGAASWPEARLIASSAFAYSCLAAPSAHSPEPSLGLLWETDGGSFQCLGPSCRVVFSSIPTALLAGSAAGSPGPLAA